MCVCLLTCSVRRRTRWSSTHPPTLGCAQQGWCTQSGCSWGQTWGSLGVVVPWLPAGHPLQTPAVVAAVLAVPPAVVELLLVVVADLHPAVVPAAGVAAVPAVFVLFAAAVAVHLVAVWPLAVVAAGGCVAAVAVVRPLEKPHHQDS